jgi:hypothetical protein
MQYSLPALAVAVLAASSAEVMGATDSWIAQYTAAKQRVDSACKAERLRDCYWSDRDCSGRRKLRRSLRASAYC